MRERRARAWERFAVAPMPGQKDEAWRYSRVGDLDLGSFAPAVLAPRAEEHADLVSAARDLARSLGPCRALAVTVPGGVIAVELPGGTGEQLRVAGSRSAEDLPVGLGSIAGLSGIFGELHDAFLGEVLTISVPPGTVLDAPVVVVNIAGSPPGKNDLGRLASFPRTFVELGAGASATVVEVALDAAEGVIIETPQGRATTLRASGEGQHMRTATPGASSTSSASLVVPVTELDVGERARLSYVSVQALGRESWQIATQASRVATGGEIISYSAGLGGLYARVSTLCSLDGEGARSTLLAAYLGTGEQVHDFETVQDHRAPSSASELVFDGAVADRARSAYNGLIRIRRGAHGADAFQTNHNLVLSEGAHADSIPNLQIEENDVRCSHASTVGPVDEEQRFYLESRGVEPAEAERLVVAGFFREAARRAPLSGVGRWVEEEMAARLEAGRRVTGGG